MKIRENLAQMMFETFNVPSLYIGDQGHLPLYASGRTTGTVCDVGYGLLQVLPIYEGKKCKHALECIPLSGQAIDDFLQKELWDNYGISHDTSYQKEVIKDMKEKLCYVALDFDSELQKAKKKKKIQ